MKNTQNEKIWLELINFVIEKTGYNKKHKLSREFSVNYDLGIDGDDADDFMAAYFELFHIELGDYEWSSYFGEEGFNPISIIFSIFKHKPALKPLTLGMLETAATMQRWDEKYLSL